MKIITWSIQKLGEKKIGPESRESGELNYFNSAGLGGNILSFMTKVISGNKVWSTLWKDGITDSPADVIVIIGVISGGQAKGNSATGSAEIVLPILKAALTAETGMKYDYVPPLVTGYRECVGILYNTDKLSCTDSGVLKKSTDEDKEAYLTPRTPFWARFTSTPAGSPLNIVGIHAPPPKGKEDTEYKKPIQYSDSFTDIEKITQKKTQTDKEPTLLLGNFHCSPVANYKTTDGKEDKEETTTHLPFTALFDTYNYGTRLPEVPPTPSPPPPKVKPDNLTSISKSVDTSKTPPASYLSRAYDNILYSHLSSTPKSKVLDLIGQARNMNAPKTPPLDPTHALTLAEYAKVSSNLPVVLEL